MPFFASPSALSSALSKAGPEVKKTGRTGVLLVNLGTPDGTDYRSMRRYLKEFLWDPRVVEMPRPLWWVILNGAILSFRPGLSGKAYEKIWNRDKNESPLRTITRDTTSALRTRMIVKGSHGTKESHEKNGGENENDLVISWAMRYGKPSIKHGLYVLQEKKGCDRILVMPLYPQYSSSTTASVTDEVCRYLKGLRLQPTLRFLAPYYAHGAYIQALKQSLEDGLAKLDFEPEKIIMSFHGIPVRYVTKGDPYQQHCEHTAKLLRKAVGMDEDRLMLTYQSRMGREPWLSPYTDRTLEQLGQQGIRKVAVLTPGFAADCVETLEEIAIAGKESFVAAGGKDFALLPSLNDSPAAIDMLEQLVRENICGWTG